MFNANNINILLGLLLLLRLFSAENFPFRDVPSVSFLIPFERKHAPTFTKLILFDHKSFQFNFIKVHVSAKRETLCIYLTKGKENILL